VFKQVLRFYFTLAIPLSYAFGLWLMAASAGQLALGLTARIIGAGLSLAGLVLWFWSYWALGRSFAVLARRQPAVGRGPYRWFNHPMYAGILLTFGGLSLALGSGSGLLFSGGFLLPLQVFRARREDKLLGRA
jgi:protein-S-isoprenylcysteine O-methyltransferase Ste14